MRGFRHWTPRYIYNRLKLVAYERAHPSAPWLTLTMVEFLASWLKPGDQEFEWGSGRSTIWFAERIGNLVSVEHNPDWYRRVSEQLRRRGLHNVEFHLCQNEWEYGSLAKKFSPESFDFCLVDGNQRDLCALTGISLVRPGGIVIVDNFNFYLPTASRSPFSRRPEQGPYTELWAAYAEGVTGWRKIWTTDGVSDTGLWVKPACTRESNHGADRFAEFFSRNHS